MLQSYRQSISWWPIPIQSRSWSRSRSRSVTLTEFWVKTPPRTLTSKTFKFITTTTFTNSCWVISSQPMKERTTVMMVAKRILSFWVMLIWTWHRGIYRNVKNWRMLPAKKQKRKSIEELPKTGRSGMWSTIKSLISWRHLRTWPCLRVVTLSWTICSVLEPTNHSSARDSKRSQVESNWSEIFN